MSRNFILAAIGLLALAFIAVVALLEPIPQDVGYHQFVDTSSVLGIANGLNTLSNLPFILVGIFGLIDLAKGSSVRYLSKLKLAYGLLFLGSILVGFGSGYYHLHPDNDTLIWDRLPMTVAFMALFAIIVAEFVSERMGAAMLWPAIALGAASVLYWAYTEAHQQGDLRPYVIVQFLPMLIIPVVLLAFPSRFTHISGYWYLLLCYLLAKAAEHFDGQIFALLGFVSGHSLKHLLAALGLLVLALSYRQREIRRLG